MFIKVFNWLLKKGAPYTTAFAMLGMIWAALVASFFAFLIFIRTDFQTTGTGKIFIYTLITSISIVSLFIFMRCGIFRLLGIKKFERPENKIINENIINGEIRQDISDKALLDTYNSLCGLTKWKVTVNMKGGFLTWLSCVLSELFFSGNFGNAFIIGAGLFIAINSLFVYGAVFYESLTSLSRKKCKFLLADRDVGFKEVPFISLKIKSKFFITLIIFCLLTILMIVQPLSYFLIISSIFLLIILGLLNNLIFDSIYRFFIEIEKSANGLAKGEKTLFFSGGSDKEMLNLSQNLNEMAKDITNYQHTLKEEKVSLEIKVKARTKELGDLAQSLEAKVKARTKELQDRVDELERFHELTIGREVRMGELKEKIEKLKEENKRLKKIKDG